MSTHAELDLELFSNLPPVTTSIYKENDAGDNSTFFKLL